MPDTRWAISLEVLEVNGLLSVQGAAQWGRRHFGVPEGGAWDTEASRAANAQLGNSPDALVLELSMARLVLKATTEISITTAGAPAAIHGTRRGYEIGETMLLEAGEAVEFGVPPEFVRTYVAIPGGIQGIERGTLLRPGVILAGGDLFAGAPSRLSYKPEVPSVLSLIPCGADSLPTELLSSTYTVGFRSNRVGIRLEGPGLEPRPESLSEPACHGMVQLDNSGSLIILGPDGPTIGGYPKLGVIPTPQLHHLAQLRPGATVKFQIQS